MSLGVERFGRLDVVVNNAGYANLASVEDMTLPDFRAQVDANLFGVVNVTKAALPYLRARGSGHIIQVSSVALRSDVHGVCAVMGSGSALRRLSQAIASQGIGAAQGAGYPVTAGHAADEAGCLGAGQPGGRDK